MVPCDDHIWARPLAGEADLGSCKLDDRKRSCWVLGSRCSLDAVQFDLLTLFIPEQSLD